MPALRLAQFSGEIPKLITRLLPDSAAQTAKNVRLDDGGLTPVRRSLLVATIDAVLFPKTIYRWGDTWLAWGTIVNAVPGPVATDRLYYTGDGAPKMRVGDQIFPLALPFPTKALTASAAGTGSGNVITRLYAYTWVTQFDEESEPSPISAEVSWQPGKTVTLSGFEAIPAGRGITKQRIYRSQTASLSGTDLFFIEERDASTANYVDTHATDDFQEVLPSKDYNPPPDDLQGLIAMPNGMMAAYSGKQLCFCEPYKPHAWPEKYRLTASYEIVALAGYASTVVAGTKGYPYVASGTAPENMIEEKIEVNLPCINPRGMVDLGYSVAYPSNDGLVVVSNGGANIVSDVLFARTDWQKISPGKIVAAQYSGRYFFSYLYTEIDEKTVYSGTIIIDMTGQQPFVIRAGFKADAFYYDLPSGALYYLVGNDVFQFDALGQTNEVMTWRSKKIVLSQPVTLGAILADSGVLQTTEQKAAREAEVQEVITYNNALLASGLEAEIDGQALDVFSVDGDGLKRMPPDKWIQIRIYADGELIRTVTELDKVKRFKPRRARFWEIEVNGTAEVEQILVATAGRELAEAG